MEDQNINLDQTQESKELEQVASVAAEQEQPEVEAEVTETAEPVEETPADELTEEAPEEERPVSHRENKRIQQLTQKLAEYNKAQTNSPTSANEPVFEEREYTPEELMQIVQQREKDSYNQGRSDTNNEVLFLTRLEIDSPRVAAKHPILDQSNDNFDAGVTDMVNQLYLKTVGFDPVTGKVQRPDIRYEEFADAYMESVERAASIRNSESKQNLVKQAAQTGVRPTGVAKKPYVGEDPSKMSNEQLEAAINQVLNIK